MHNGTLLQHANVVTPQLNCCVLLSSYRNFKEHGEDKIQPCYSRAAIIRLNTYYTNIRIFAVIIK